VQLGSVEITPLVDSIGTLGALTENYPKVPAEDWAPYAELYPEVFNHSDWRLPCASYLLSTAGRTILVDTGTGPAGFWEDEAEFDARLPAALVQHGMAADDIDIVYITHVHGDHIGWNTDAVGDPTFHGARYLMHPEAAARARERLHKPQIARCFAPLFEQDLVDEVDSGTEIAPGVVTVALPGHDPGHSGLRVSSEGAGALLIGDAISHPALLDRPDWVFKWDHDPAQSKVTRAAVVDALVDTDVLLVCGHYPGSGIGRLRTRDGRVVFETVD
jgi:glyoxylase-like metal-dependent hydrolase (beta-lactamase superfamily II)